MVFSGLVMLWRLAGWPTRTWPSSVKATIDGVVRPPSAFSITLALFPSITATQEFVVPRSIPIAFAMTRLLVFRCVRVALARPASAEWNWAPLQSFPGHVRDAHRKRRARPATAWGSSGLLGLAVLCFRVLHLDLLRLPVPRLRNHDLENSVRHRGLDARRIDAGRELQYAEEHAVASFAVLNVLIVLILLDPLFAADSEGVILDRYLDILALESWHLRANLDGLVRLGDVDIRDNICLGAVTGDAL